MKTLLLAPLGFIRLLFQSTFLAMGQIWANKTRSLLTTIGIIIGVASVTAVIATLTGLKAKVLDDLESFGTNKIYINVRRPQNGPLSSVSYWQLRFEYKQFDGLLEHCPSVESFTRISPGDQLTVRNRENTIEGVRISGVEPSWAEVENRNIVLGRPFSVIDEEQGQRVCLIDEDLRDELMLNRDCIGDTILLGSRTFRIVGVLEKRPEMTMGGGMDGDNYEVQIPFSTNKKLKGKVWIWVIAASKSTDVSEDAESEINFFLRRTRGIRPGQEDTFQVQTIASELKTFNEVSAVITLVASGVVGISLLVGGVGIMNIMLVSVSERTREIGLRKAVGAKKTAILTQFLVEAIVLCLFGGFAGIGFGHLLTTGIASMGPAMDKAQIPLWAIGIAFGFSAFVGICFGMFPAIKAARLDPIEALRHE